MLKILADSSLPHLELFQPAFELSYYENEDSLKEQIVNSDILICRSTLAVTSKLLQNTRIQCIATASSGVDHIDQPYLNQHNISLFDAKGCNAHAVADYISACTAWLLKNHKFQKLKAGVIGLGCVGTLVSQRLKQFGFQVLEYDPLKAIEMSSFHTCTLTDLKSCELISIHANLHNNQPFSSQNLLNDAFLSDLGINTVILNASRGGVVNETDLLHLDKKIVYCTDVYENEPHINAKIVNFATLCTPHIAGHSLEAKSNAVIYLAQALHAHFRLEPAHSFSFLKPQLTPILLGESLADYFLKRYSPVQETQLLKQAAHKSTAFLTLRKAHRFRHDWDPAGWDNSII